MNESDFNELLEDGRFSPFVITMTDGFAIAVGPEQKRHILVGARMVVMLDSAGGIVHLPYRSMAHIQELKGGPV